MEIVVLLLHLVTQKVSNCIESGSMVEAQNAANLGHSKLLRNFFKPIESRKYNLNS